MMGTPNKPHGLCHGCRVCRCSCYWPDMDFDKAGQVVRVGDERLHCWKKHQPALSDGQTCELFIYEPWQPE